MATNRAFLIEGYIKYVLQKKKSENKLFFRSVISRAMYKTNFKTSCPRVNTAHAHTGQRVETVSANWRKQIFFLLVYCDIGNVYV